jgi:hypothetical protein
MTAGDLSPFKDRREQSQNSLTHESDRQWIPFLARVPAVRSISRCAPRTNRHLL